MGGYGDVYSQTSDLIREAASIDPKTDTSRAVQRGGARGGVNHKMRISNWSKPSVKFS
jgi:hypothetical protein